MALKDLTALAQAVAGASKAQVETAKESVISEVRTTVVKEVVKETMDVEDMDALATDSEVDQKLLDYVRKTDIFENDQFTTRYNHVNGSYAQLWNESDGGGSQYYNQPSDIISYVGTNNGDSNGICVQIYSKYKDGINNTKNSGVRINVNPSAAYYTKGTDTSTTGSSTDTEIATLGNIKTELTNYIKKTDILKSGNIYNKYNGNDGSFALLFNESDGGGAQYFNKTSDILSYVGTNNGDQNGVCVQIYSKYRDGVSNTYNSGVRINVNPNGAYYTKGTDTSANGGSSDTEIATLADIKTLVSRIDTLVSRIDTLENTVANLTNS